MSIILPPLVIIRILLARGSFLNSVSTLLCDCFGAFAGRKSKIIFGDWPRALRKACPIVCLLLALGHLISHFTPSIFISGVRVFLFWLGSMNSISLPNAARAFAARNSDLNGGIERLEMSIFPAFILKW